MSRSRVAHQARGFVQHNEAGIFVDKGEFHRLRLQVAWTGRRNGQSDAVPSPYPVAGLGGTSVDLGKPLPDEILGS